MLVDSPCMTDQWPAARTLLCLCQIIINNIHTFYKFNDIYPWSDWIMSWLRKREAAFAPLALQLWFAVLWFFSNGHWVSAMTRTCPPLPHTLILTELSFMKMFHWQMHTDLRESQQQQSMHSETECAGKYNCKGLKAELWGTVVSMMQIHWPSRMIKLL